MSISGMTLGIEDKNPITSPTSQPQTPEQHRFQAIASIVSGVLKMFGVNSEVAKGVGTIAAQYVNGEISRAEAEKKMNQTQTNSGINPDVASNNTQDILNQIEAQELTGNVPSVAELSQP